MEHMFVSDSQVSAHAPEVLAEVLARLDQVPEPSAAELDAMLLALEQVSRRVEAALLQVVAAADRTQHFIADGHRTVTAWQQAWVNGSRATALARTQSARLVHQAPEVGERLAAGDIGVEQVRVVGRVAANPRVSRRLFDDDEGWIPTLVDLAVSLTLTDFRLTVDRWEQLADSDGSGGERAHRRRFAHLSIVGDTTVLKAQFDAATGVVLREILTAFERAEFATGDPQRTAAQRRADALGAVFHGAVGQRGGVNITVNLVVDADNLQRLVTAQPLNPGPDARCNTLDGTALPPGVLLSAALVGQLRTIVMDRTGVVMSMGRRRRLFTGAVRAAARLQGIRCVWPGCGAAFTEVDHRVAWCDGGSTDPHNAAPLCDWHNRWRFDHRYAVDRDTDGRLRIRRPDGSQLPVAA